MRKNIKYFYSYFFIILGSISLVAVSQMDENHCMQILFPIVELVQISSISYKKFIEAFSKITLCKFYFLLLSLCKFLQFLTKYLLKHSNVSLPIIKCCAAPAMEYPKWNNIPLWSIILLYVIVVLCFDQIYWTSQHIKLIKSFLSPDFFSVISKNKK